MPYAIVLVAYAKQVSSLRSINGAQLQGAFLDLIRRVTPTLSNELHAGDMLRPYALALLNPKLGQHCDTPLKKIVLRIACLDDRIYPSLLKLALSDTESAILQIGSAKFQIAELVTISEQQFGWADFASYQDIIDRAEKAGSLSNLIELKFASATVFTQGLRGDTPMPMPEYVFGGLARRWNNAPNVPISLPTDFQEQVREHITVSHLNGETVVANIGDNLKKTGFTGFVTYRIHQPAIGFWCHLLAEAAFFSGLGAKTSRGLGCVRKVR